MLELTLNTKLCIKHESIELAMVTFRTIPVLPISGLVLNHGYID